MLLIPAIDLKDGRCVRLRQGRMEDETVFSDDPVEMAGRWVGQGSRRLHLVDLNGAFAGRGVNCAAVAAIRAASTVPIQLGGGLRDRAGIERKVDLDGIALTHDGQRSVVQQVRCREVGGGQP